MDEDLETTKTNIGRKYPDKKIIIIKYGHSLPLRVYMDAVIIWLNSVGNVKKIDVY